MISKELATFAGGCFWCMQPPYDGIAGVLKTSVGYIGGHTKNPTYEEVCSGMTGHAEALQITFDPCVVSYETLLSVFWRNIDPTNPNGQFADRGSQYRTAIFYHSALQKELAEKSKQKLQSSKKFVAPIVTEIVAATTWYDAEDYHQCYYQKNRLHYELYKEGSGRKAFIEKNWKG